MIKDMTNLYRQDIRNAKNRFYMLLNDPDISRFMALDEYI